MNKHILRFFQIVSDVFGPLSVPTYGMIVAMWLTPLNVLPERNKILVTLLIALFTGLLPLLFIAGLIRMGKVSDNSISDRRQRPLPYSVTTVCYIAAALFLGSVRAPLWLQLFFYGAAFATLVALLISFGWKISAHTTALGGFVGLLGWLAIDGLADVNAMMLLSVGVILAGLVGTSRLALGRHTLGQVAAGFILGLICTLLPNIIIYF